MGPPLDTENPEDVARRQRLALENFLATRARSALLETQSRPVPGPQKQTWCRAADPAEREQNEQNMRALVTNLAGTAQTSSTTPTDSTRFVNHPGASSSRSSDSSNGADDLASGSEGGSPSDSPPSSSTNAKIGSVAGEVRERTWRDLLLALEELAEREPVTKDGATVLKNKIDEYVRNDSRRRLTRLA